MQFVESFLAVSSVWHRHREIYARDWKHSMVTTFAEPLLYLMSFGVGMSTLISQVAMNGEMVSYRSFVFSGIVAQSLLYQGFFVALYGVFSRIHYQKLYLAIVTTPVTLPEALWAELIWNASRATLASVATLLIGSLSGDFHPLGAAAAIPVCFVAALLFASLGMLVAALANTFNDLSYAQFYLVAPMFLMCGVFFPLDSLPAWLQMLTWLFPLTPVLSVLRSLLLGLDLELSSLILIAAWTVICIALAHRMMALRLVK